VTFCGLLCNQLTHYVTKVLVNVGFGAVGRMLAVCSWKENTHTHEGKVYLSLALQQLHPVLFLLWCWNTSAYNTQFCSVKIRFSLVMFTFVLEWLTHLVDALECLSFQHLIPEFTAVSTHKAVVQRWHVSSLPSPFHFTYRLNPSQ